MAIIACDVDGLVANLMRVWLEKYNKDWNDNLKVKNVKDWGIQNYVKPECGLKIFNYIKDPSLYDEVLPFPGALDFINKLKENHKVFFVTASPPEQMGRKFYWLKEHGFIRKITQYVEARNKSLIRADWLIDDYHGNTKGFIGKTILLARPWNEGQPNRIKSYKDALAIINAS